MNNTRRETGKKEGLISRKVCEEQRNRYGILKSVEEGVFEFVVSLSWFRNLNVRPSELSIGACPNIYYLAVRRTHIKFPNFNLEKK